MFLLKATWHHKPIWIFVASGAPLLAYLQHSSSSMTIFNANASAKSFYWYFDGEHININIFTRGGSISFFRCITLWTYKILVNLKIKKKNWVDLCYHFRGVSSELLQWNAVCPSRVTVVETCSKAVFSRLFHIFFASTWRILAKVIITWLPLVTTLKRLICAETSSNKLVANCVSLLWHFQC